NLVTVPYDATEKQVSFSAAVGRYIRLRALSEVNGGPWTSMAELNVVGTAVGGTYLQSVSLNPASVVGGNPSQGTVTLNSPPQAGWTVQLEDSQETGCGGNHPATNSFDGSGATMWHTQFCSTLVTLPHEIQIDMHATYTLTGFHYLPRQDGGTNGDIKQYEFY